VKQVVDTFSQFNNSQSPPVQHTPEHQQDEEQWTQTFLKATIMGCSIP